MRNYGRLPVSFVRGAGNYLYDTEGQAYLDAMGGIAVCALGHSHPAVIEAIQQQAETLMHVSNYFHIPAQAELAQRLCQISGLTHVFFCNSGTEANEGAIKIARRYGHVERQLKLPKIIVTERAFHGRTLAALTATGNQAARAGFEPLVDGFIRVPYNDIDAMQQAFAQGDIAAVLLEPIQGEGGIHPADTQYLKDLRQLCTNHDALLMLDEIQSGIGRTGRWFAYQHADIQPDVLSVAKALGNGMPIGATLAQGIAAEVLVPGSHGTTFGGNPLACSAGLAVINTLDEQQLVQQADQVGQQLMQRLQQQLASLNSVRDIRGRGCMLGIELDADCSNIMLKSLQQHHTIINVTAGNVIRLLPSYLMNIEEVQQVVDVIQQQVEVNQQAA